MLKGRPYELPRWLRWAVWLLQSPLSAISATPIRGGRAERASGLAPLHAAAFREGDLDVAATMQPEADAGAPERAGVLDLEALRPAEVGEVALVAGHGAPDDVRQLAEVFHDAGAMPSIIGRSSWRTRARKKR